MNKRGARRGLCALVTVSALAVASPGTGAAAPPPSTPTVPAAGSVKVEAALVDQFEKSGEARDFWVSFDERPEITGAEDIADWGERGAYVVDRLRQAADAAQGETVELLEAAGVEYTAYWITNAIRVEGGDRLLAEQLAADPDVERIFAPVAYERSEPVERTVTGSRLTPNAAAIVEWGVGNIGADQVWERYGVRGDGVVVGSIDTGAQVDHPALISSYRGYDAEAGAFDNDYNWFDTSGASSYPNDANGHGTHTMGTMVGDDGAANRIGVAPGAKWITANGCCPSDQALVDSAQWMLAPTKVDGTAPDPAKRPHIVNNSWGTQTPSTDPFAEDILTAWADAGMFGVWANGNSGEVGCASSGSPGSRILNYSAGAHDSTDTVASFSGRGPGQDGEIKPDISAPGVNVRSSLPGSQYGALSGTSMAAPHLAGAIALLWSADPTLIGDLERTRQLLDDTAIDTPDDQCGGTDDDNNVYGEGRLDALALVEATDQTGLGTVSGTVTSTESGDPVRGAVVRFVAGSLVRSARTGDDGTYTANVPAGEYQATVSAFGHKTTTVPVTVTADQTTTTDVVLPGGVGFTITGRVLDQTTGEGLRYARVTVAGTRFVATTGTDGTFSLANVPGPRDYLVTIDGGGCTAGEVRRSVAVRGDTELPTVRVPRKTDQSPFAEGWWDSPYGYSCGLEPTEWIEGDTRFERPGGHGSNPIELPFTFTYFGKRYDTLNISSFGRASFWTRGPERSVFFGLSPFGADMTYYDESGIYTRAAGRAPNRTFTVEWRDLGWPGLDNRISYAVTLHENGDIVFAYDGLDENSLLERGDRANVGMTGPSPDLRAVASTTFEYAGYEPVLTDDYQIRFSLPPAGSASGVVTDGATRAPVPGATVDLYGPTGKLLRRVKTGEDGRYWFELFAGRQYRITARKPPGYPTEATASARVTGDRQGITVDHVLSGGGFDVRPGRVELERGEDATVRVRNVGTSRLDWYARTALPRSDEPAPGAGLGSVDTTGLIITGVEEVNENYWVAGLTSAGAKLYEITESGMRTGQVISVRSVLDRLGVTDIAVPGDLAWVPSRNRLCMTFVGAYVGEIACVSPYTGSVATIPTGFGSETRHEGLAYDEERDLFFVTVTHRGGGYQYRLRTIAGFDHQTPGAAMNTCIVTRQAQGLGWNPTSRTLWTNTQQQTEIESNRTILRQLDPVSCAEISEVPLDPRFGVAATGLDLGPNGEVLNTFGFGQRFNRFSNGDPIVDEPEWVSLSAESGTLDRRQRDFVQLTVDWRSLPDDTDRFDLVLSGNGGATPTVTIPVTIDR